MAKKDISELRDNAILTLELVPKGVLKEAGVKEDDFRKATSTDEIKNLVRRVCQKIAEQKELIKKKLGEKFNQLREELVELAEALCIDQWVRQVLAI